MTVIFFLASFFAYVLLIPSIAALQLDGLRPRSLSFRLTRDHSTQVHGDRITLTLTDRDGGNNSVLRLLTRPTMVYKPPSVEHVLDSRRLSMTRGISSIMRWQPMTIEGPDIEDRHTLQQLAMMSGNAYQLPGRKDWYDLDEAWNISFPFGWEDTADGFRGHVFVSSDNSTVILSIKGTTLQGPTSKKDKFNDNLLFSCCCARVDFTWMFSTALVEESLFYSVGVNLFNNLTLLYPNANIWLTGHSLGGALAALLGSTFGVPAVAFESPGERLAAQRLHLPIPPLSPITHVYHNADPIPQGTCTGLTSPCAEAGFALETGCHLGRKIVYDTVNHYHWRVDVRKHVIREIITKLLADEREWEPGRSVPLAKEEDEDCIDCYKWEFGDFKTDDISR